MKSVALHDVCYRYPLSAHNAIDKLSLTLECGSTHILCGPTGSGKSTLALLLAGLISPTEGRIDYSAESLSMRREIGMVFQFPERLFFRDSVEDEFDYLSPLPERNEIKALFSKLELPYDALANKHPTQVSFGTARMLALALQLARAPSLLIVDEPTIGLDERHWNKVLSLLKDFRLPENILLVVTHDLDLIESLRGTSHIVSENKLHWSGTVDRLLSDNTLMRSAGLIQ